MGPLAEGLSLAGRSAFRRASPAILSASRRTDIPAFYSAWFMNRVRAGFCVVPNPFRPGQLRRVSLAPVDVSALVFWSKNPKPMFEFLPELNDLGFRYYFLFTLNNYPAALEPGVPGIAQRLDTFAELSRRISPERVVWRYDPIVLTPATDHDFHAATFERLAAFLRGATRRVVVSFMEPYRKTRVRMRGLTGTVGGPDGSADEARRAFQLLSRIGSAARSAGMTPFSCAQETDLSPTGILPGGCIDAELLASLGARRTRGKDPGQRAACRCAPSRDIGMYDTCVHACRYCYATASDRTAQVRHAGHDPESPILFAPVVRESHQSGRRGA